MVERTSPISGVMFVTLMIFGMAIPGWTQTAARGEQLTTRLLPVSAVLTDAGGQPRKERRWSRSDSSMPAGRHAALDRSRRSTRRRSRPIQCVSRRRVARSAGSLQQRTGSLAQYRRGRTRAPRIMLVAVPYALRAADAETLGGKRSPLSYWLDPTERRAPAMASPPTFD